ncbi:MAG: SCO family protein [Ferruginibacter sp.]
MKIFKNKVFFYVVFFVLLLAVFYAFVFSDYDFNASSLKVINPAVPAFKFTSQDGTPVTQRNTDDRVYVAEYFFTSCKGICPKMNTNMRRVYDAYKDENDFLILSHTCMPETDSVPVMKAYEEKMLKGNLVKNADGSYKFEQNPAAPMPANKNWYFLTGTKDDLYRMARQGYLIDNGNADSTQRIEDQFIHTQFFALVDRYRRVRGIYDGLKDAEIEKLISDIKGLLKEKVDHTRFMNGFSNSPS